MKKIIKSFFYSNKEFNPAKAWITNFLIMISIIVVLDTCTIRTVSDTRLLGMLGFVLGWIGVYSWYRRDLNEKRIVKKIKKRR